MIRSHMAWYEMLWLCDGMPLKFSYVICPPSSASSHNSISGNMKLRMNNTEKKQDKFR